MDPYCPAQDPLCRLGYAVLGDCCAPAGIRSALVEDPFWGYQDPVSD